MRSMEPYVVLAHPYLFDTFFRSLRWCGSGHVTIRDVVGGINSVRCVVEADEEGCRSLKAAGFVVEEFVQKCDAAASSARQ